MADKFTFKQFQARYPDDDACLLAILKRRYKNINACPHCGIVGKLTRIAGRRAFACSSGCHTYPCAGTIFEHSSTVLTTWFHAIYLMTATRNGVSGKELQRQLGITYKCAWRIGQQLRDLMTKRNVQQNPGPLSGHIEVDETYVGGRLRKFEGRGKGFFLKNKATVMGVVQRDGAIKTTIIENERIATMVPVVQANIAKGSTVSTDTHSSYAGLSKLGYRHGSLNHNIHEWKRGVYCTNTIEGFWSHLKRGISSTHVSVSKQHLHRYVNEFAFRYNNRHAPAEMFERMIADLATSGGSN
jgi:transposase